MTIRERMIKENIKLPPFNKAVANYLPAVRSGNLIFTAGQTPKINGVLRYKGKVDDDDYQKGIDAAELCALNCISVIEECIGNLENVKRIIKVSGFVNAVPEFTKHAIVMDGATDILVKIFGDNGIPVRSAVGMSSLPGDATIEIEMIVEVSE